MLLVAEMTPLAVDAGKGLKRIEISKALGISAPTVRAMLRAETKGAYCEQSGNQRP